MVVELCRTGRIVALDNTNGMNGSATRCATARGMSMRGSKSSQKFLIASAASALAIVSAMPAQAEQIGLNCTLTQSHYAADGTRVRSSGASMTINIDTTRKVWWSTNTRQHDQNLEWNFFEGAITSIASVGSEYIELVRLDDYDLYIGVNRRTGRFYGRQVTTLGNTGEWSGTCVRGSFGQPPERRF